MATVITYTCTAGNKNEKPNDDDVDDGGGFFLALYTFCHWHAFGFFGYQQYFYFHSWQRWYFYLCIVFIVDFWIYSNTQQYRIQFDFFFIFGFCYFSLLYSFSYMCVCCWKPTVIRNFQFGWTVGRSIFTLIETIYTNNVYTHTLILW